VKKLTQGNGATVVFDTVGGLAAFETALTLLANKGRLVEISATGGSRVSFDLLDFYRRDLRLFGVNTLNQTSQESANLLRSIGEEFEKGSFKAPTFKTYKLEEADKAFEEVAKGAKDKILLKP
jgi:NADPH:quinone reductase-like Zn-dependent oxidoreductase